MGSLSPKQRKYLKGLGHPLSPVLIVGNKGIDEAFVKELKSALLVHELVKVKVPGEARQDAAETLARKSGAELVQLIGRSVLLYQRHPEKPSIELPSKSGTAAPPVTKTKRTR